MIKVLIVLVLCSLLSSCAGKSDNENVSVPEEKQSILELNEASDISDKTWESSPGISGNRVDEEYMPASSEPEEISQIDERPVSQAAAPSSSAAPPSSAVSPSAPAAPSRSAQSSSSVAESSKLTAEKEVVSYLIDVERQVISLINEERSALGLGSLQYDESLRGAARIRSKELYDYSYFAHTRPDGTSWQTVLKKDMPVAYISAGENLANVEHNMKDYDPAYDASHWFNTWKNSPAHYENIIHPDFTHVGVGVYYIKTGDMVLAYAATLFCSY